MKENRLNQELNTSDVGFMLDTSSRGLRLLGYVSSIKPPSSVYNSYLYHHCLSFYCSQQVDFKRIHLPAYCLKAGGGI